MAKQLTSNISLNDAEIPQNIRDQVGFLIIDEAHKYCTSSSIPCLLAFHPKYILVISDTLERGITYTK